MVEFLVFDVIAPTQFTNLECKSYLSSIESGIYSNKKFKMQSSSMLYLHFLIQMSKEENNL